MSVSERLQSENPLYLDLGTLAAAGTDTSDGFTLLDSEFFAVEWLFTGTLDSSGISLKLQMQTHDGTWIDAREGDTSNGTAKSALVTGETSLARGFVTPTPPYTRGRLRIHATNGCSGNVAIVVKVHFSRSGLR